MKTTLRPRKTSLPRFFIAVFAAFVACASIGARIDDIAGQVWLYSPDTGEWIAAARNRPVTTGDHLATDNGARAELAIGSTVLRLDGATEVEVTRLDDQQVELHVDGGSVGLRLRDQRAVGELQITTSDGRVRFEATGRYRVDRLQNATDITVYAGQAVYEGPNSALPLQVNQHGQFWIDANGAAQYNLYEPARDAFAAWNVERDRAQDVASVRYVSPR